MMFVEFTERFWTTWWWGIILKLAGDGCSAEHLSIQNSFCTDVIAWTTGPSPPDFGWPRWMFPDPRVPLHVQWWIELELVRQVGRGKVQQTFVHLGEHEPLTPFVEGGPAKLVLEGWAAGAWRFTQYHAHSIVLYMFNFHADGRVAWMPYHWAIVYRWGRTRLLNSSLRVLHGRKELERLTVESAANDLRRT